MLPSHKEQLQTRTKEEKSITEGKKLQTFHGKDKEGSRSMSCLAPIPAPFPLKCPNIFA